MRARPGVKSGEVRPDELTGEEALALMVGDPLLIRRPLMQVGDELMAGFDQQTVEAWIGLHPTDRPVTDDCPRSDRRHR